MPFDELPPELVVRACGVEIGHVCPPVKKGCTSRQRPTLDVMSTNGLHARVGMAIGILQRCGDRSVEGELGKKRL